MKRLILATLVMLCGASVLFAQGRKIAFRTLCLETTGGIDKANLAGKDAKEMLEVPLYTDISPVITGFFASGNAEFFRETTGPEGTIKRQVLARGVLGKSSRQLFFFLPSGKTTPDEPPYRLFCYDDDVRSFGMGHIRAINLATVPVRFQIAGQMTPQISPGKIAIFPHSKKVNAYKMYQVVTEFLSGNGQWIKGQSVSWKATDRRREIVVTLVDTTFKQPMVRMYSDSPEWLETTAGNP